MVSQRTTAIALAISVAVNLFVLGVVASWGWQRRDTSRHPHRAPAALERRGDSARGDVGAWLSEAERAELRPRRKALRQLRREAEESLRAESFDVEKFRASLTALRRETDAIQGAVHDLLIKRASALGPEERRRLADANWPRVPERHRRGDGRRRPPMRD